MHDTTETPITPAVLAFCRAHRTFFPLSQACPQCTHHPEQLTPVGTLLLGVCVGLVVAYVLLQGLLGPGHGPWGWW